MRVSAQQWSIVARLRHRAGFDDESEWRFLQRWLALSLLFMLLAAWRSAGYYHPDEQFQTLEFAGVKLGLTPLEALPWEHRLRMRSWLQPGLYVVVVSALRRIGLGDPFAWATSLRVLSGLYAWTALVGLALCCRRWLDDPGSRRTAIRLVSTFCLLPFLLVRTSSESLAASSFFLGVALFELGAADRERPGARTLFLTGVFFGLAFEFRFPVGLMVGGWFAWASLVRGRPARELIAVGLGAASVVAAAAPIDRWGYGQWTLPPLNFVIENVRGGRAGERFGSMPPWGYLELLVRSPLAPATIVAALVTAVAWIRWPRHVLTWCGSPLLLAHSLIGHKELRFLFPLVPASALAFGLAFAPGADRLEPLARFWRGPAARGLRLLLFGANGVVLAVLCLVPVFPQPGLLRFVYEELPRDGDLLVLGPDSPYGPDDLVGHFYRPRGLQVRVVSAPELREALHGDDRPSHIVVREGLRPELLGPWGERCRELYRSVPTLLDGVPGIRVLDRWVLFQCAPPRSSTGSSPR